MGLSRSDKPLLVGMSDGGYLVLADGRFAAHYGYRLIIVEPKVPLH